MKTTFLRFAVVVMLIAALAMVPLSSVLAGGHFEIGWPGTQFTSPVRVVLDDHTRLAREISAAPPPPGSYVAVTNSLANRQVLIVTVDGSSCDRLIQLVLDHAANGYVIRERTERWPCPFGTGYERSIAIYLWAPVDAATVRFESTN